MKALIIVLLTAGIYFAEGAEKLSVYAKSGANPERNRSWKAYAGPETISEPELFSLAGDLDMADAAQNHRNEQLRRIVGGPAMIAGGVMLAWRPGQENGNFTTPFVAIGVAAASYGMYNLSRWLFTPRRAAPYSAAKEAADAYNAQHGLADKP